MTSPGPGRRPRMSRGAAGLALVLCLAHALAFAHAALVRSTPTRRATLDKPPARVQLWFNERLEPAFSRLSVWDQGAAQVDLGGARVPADDPTALSVGVPALTPGTYVVRFRVLSLDGHVVEGEFPFTIRGR